MQSNNNWGQPRSAGVKLGLIVRISLALIATVGSVALAWTLLSPHTKAAHAAGITEVPTTDLPWSDVLDQKNGFVYVAESKCQMLPTCKALGGTPAPTIIGQFKIASPTGSEVAFQEPATGGYTNPAFLAVDANGNVWFTEPDAKAIGELTPSGTGTWKQFPTGATSAPHDLTVDTSGNIWFTDFLSNGIGFLNPNNSKIVITPLSTKKSDPYGITLDGSGKVWFAENGHAAIGTFTPSTTGNITITEDAITTGTFSHLIAVDKNGHVWYSEENVGSLGEYDPVGKVVTDHALPAGLCTPAPCAPQVAGIGIDGGNRVWFDVQSTVNAVGYYDPASKTFATTTLISSNGWDGLVVDGANNAWVTEYNSSLLAEVPLAAVTPGGTPTPTASSTTTSTVTPTVTPTGTITPTGTPAPPPNAPVSKVWYFAEGKVGAGFIEYITIENPDPSNICSVNIEYLLGNGAPPTQPIVLPITVNPKTRFTEGVNHDLASFLTSGPAASVEVSTIVSVSSTDTACKGVVAERPMYFTNFASVSSGTDVVGATRLSKTFYFADVPQIAGYNSFITILNPPASLPAISNVPNKHMTPTPTSTSTVTPTPTSTPTVTPTSTLTPSPTPNPGLATINVTYYQGGSAVGTSTLQVATGMRGTINPPRFNTRVSAIVTSDTPVVVERPSYFTNIAGGNAGTVSGTGSVIGATSPASDWLFAEGYTGGGFQEVLVLSNFGASGTPAAAANITLEYQNGATQTVPVTVAAGDVATYDINSLNTTPTGTCVPSPCLGEITPNVSIDVSTSSSTPIVAEREMFFNYNNGHDLRATGGTDVTGTVAPASSIYTFAEGYTNTGYNEWLTLQNPTSSPETIGVTIVNTLGGSTVQDYTVGAKARYTVDVTSLVKATLAPPGSPFQNYEISMVVQSSSGGLFVAERPMYFNANGSQGGSDVFGY